METSLTYKDFRMLATLAERFKNMPTQRDLAHAAGLSVGTVNGALANLSERGLVDAHGITSLGVDALEPYRVKRAVLIAAGFGSRMVPITLNTPKPLVRVGGVRIIDSILDALVAAGIEEVHVVRGYLAEQFDQLLYKYPSIHFIENPIYNEANNISSLLMAKDLLQGAYVMESDILLRNPALLSRYQYDSNYLGVPTDKTDDWCFQVRSGFITSMMVGGVDCYRMFGISYWTERDGAQLARDIPAVFEQPGGKERYWDEVPLRYFADHYKVRIRPCSFDDICEIDTFRELQQLDPAYAV